MAMTKKTIQTATTWTMTKTDALTDKIVILTAAGSSTRMGTGKKKEYLKLDGGTVLSKAAASFLTAAFFSMLIVTVPEGGEKDAREALFADERMPTLLKNTKLLFVNGGKTRQESVFNALTAAARCVPLKEEKPVVLIHDAARPFVTEKIIQDTISAALLYGAAVPAIAAVDTQKEISENGTIARHLQRKMIVAVQTPQAFELYPLLECHKAASLTQKEYTDDTEIWDAYPELNGKRSVRVVEGDRCNYKITYAEDLEKNRKMVNTTIRIGLGTDLHALSENRKLFLGGIEIPAAKGEQGHSDGDALLHAIADALLGASGLGDIGSYFPPEEKKWKDADSRFLLKQIWTDVKKAGWSLNNLDCVIEIEKPKILPWRQKIIASIAEILETETSRVFVKAKTNEKLDAVGSENAVKTYCTCLLMRQVQE